MQAIPAKCNTITRRTDNTRTLFLQLNHPCIHSSLSLATVSFSSIALSYLANNLFEGRPGRNKYAGMVIFHRRYNLSSTEGTRDSFSLSALLPWTLRAFVLFPTDQPSFVVHTHPSLHSFPVTLCIYHLLHRFLCQQLFQYLRSSSTDSPSTGTQVAFAFVIKYILFFTLSYSLNSFFLY